MTEEQLATLKYLAKCFGNSTRHLKLCFNGPTCDAANLKNWMDTFSRFQAVETLSLKVQSGLNYLHLFRNIAEQKGYPWYRSLRRVELLDISGKCDQQLLATTSVLATIRHLEQLTYFLDHPLDAVLEKMSKGYVDKVVTAMPEGPA